MARLQADSVQQTKCFTVLDDQSPTPMPGRRLRFYDFEAILLHASLYVLKINQVDVVIRSPYEYL